jgi:hypothetical protein
MVMAIGIHKIFTSLSGVRVSGHVLFRKRGEVSMTRTNRTNTARTATLLNTCGMLAAGGAGAEDALASAQLHTPWPHSSRYRRLHMIRRGIQLWLRLA